MTTLFIIIGASAVLSAAFRFLRIVLNKLFNKVAGYEIIE